MRPCKNSFLNSIQQTVGVSTRLLNCCVQQKNELLEFDKKQFAILIEHCHINNFAEKLSIPHQDYFRNCQCVEETESDKKTYLALGNIINLN